MHLVVLIQGGWHNIVKEVVFQMSGEILHGCLCTRRHVDHLSVVHRELLSYWNSICKCMREC